MAQEYRCVKMGMGIDKSMTIDLFFFGLYELLDLKGRINISHKSTPKSARTTMSRSYICCSYATQQSIN